MWGTSVVSVCQSPAPIPPSAPLPLALALSAQAAAFFHAVLFLWSSLGILKARGSFWWLLAERVSFFFKEVAGEFQSRYNFKKKPAWGDFEPAEIGGEAAGRAFSSSSVPLFISGVFPDIVLQCVCFIFKTSQDWKAASSGDGVKRDCQILSPQNSYKAGQNWQPSPPSFPESIIPASWKRTTSTQQSEKGLCIRNCWNVGLKWWQSVSLHLMLLSCPPPSSVHREALPGQCRLWRVTRGSLSWEWCWLKWQFWRWHVGRDSSSVSPRLQAYLGQERKTVWRKNP